MEYPLAEHAACVLHHVLRYHTMGSHYALGYYWYHVCMVSEDALHHTLTHSVSPLVVIAEEALLVVIADSVHAVI